MRSMQARLFWLFAGLAMATLALTGCFQVAGEPLPPTQPGSGGAPAGAGVAPTQPPPAQPLPTTAVAVLFTDTPVVPDIRPPTQEQIAPPLATATPTTQQPLFVGPTITAEGLAEGQGGSDAQGVEAALPLGATPLPLAAVEQTAIAQIPTLTPTVSLLPTLPTSTPTTEPVGDAALTATALVAGATQRAADEQTATATALGTYVPTATPTPTATLEPGATPEPGADCVHVVQRGETAYRIARRYGVTLDEIARANGLTNLSILSVGQELIIPGCGTTGITPTPAPATEEAAAATEEAPSGQTYLIQPGDNLYRIALRFGVTVRALANANGITNINYIRAGDTLTIP